MRKYLVITGGSRGIGEKTIARFIKEGWQAINIARHSCPLPEVKNLHVDLNHAESLATHKATLAAMLAEADQICLVHNAAAYQLDSVANLDLKNLRQTLEINLISPAALNNIILPMMRPGSSIIYIGTTLAEKGVPNHASYIIAKHALVGLMRATCQDLAGRGIHSSCVCPGLVRTQLLKDNMDEETLSFLLNNKVIGKRLIEPQEVAEVIYFCANTPLINGVTLHANLGQMAD